MQILKLIGSIFMTIVCGIAAIIIFYDLLIQLHNIK